MASKKRTSRSRRSSRTRSNRSSRLVRNGMVMKIVVPVAIAGAGVAAYLLWKKSRANAAIASNSSGALAPDAGASASSPGVQQNDFISAPPTSGKSNESPVDALIRTAGSTANSLYDAATNAYQSAIKAGLSVTAANNAANAAKLRSQAIAGIGTYYDVSAAGAPYTGMFGVDGLGSMAVSTVEPHDLARKAIEGPRLRPVTTPFASVPRTGGVFSRDLFTGME